MAFTGFISFGYGGPATPGGRYSLMNIGSSPQIRAGPTVLRLHEVHEELNSTTLLQLEEPDQNPGSRLLYVRFSGSGSSVSAGSRSWTAVGLRSTGALVSELQLELDLNCKYGVILSLTCRLLSPLCKHEGSSPWAPIAQFHESG